MVNYAEERVMRPLHFAIIDEVDSILIDEARTPLIISGEAEKSTSLYTQANVFAKMLKAEDDYKYDEKTKAVHLTEQGATKLNVCLKLKIYMMYRMWKLLVTLIQIKSTRNITT